MSLTYLLLKESYLTEIERTPIPIHFPARCRDCSNRYGVEERRTRQVAPSGAVWLCHHVAGCRHSQRASGDTSLYFAGQRERGLLLQRLGMSV